MYKKFLVQISNHKTAERLRLMKFLMTNQRNPQKLDFTYEGYVSSQLGALR
jgi:hypothetical protein